MNWFGGAVGGEENAFELETYPNVDGISFAFRGENIRVDWGDGTIEEYAGPTSADAYVTNDMYASHSWASTGDGQIIKIDGNLEGVWFGGFDTAGSTSTFNYFINQVNPLYRANYRFYSVEEVAENVAQGSIKKIVNWGTMDTHKVKTAPIGPALGYNIFFGSPSDLILGSPVNFHSGYFATPYGGYVGFPLPTPNSDYIIPTVVELPPDTGPDLRGVTNLNYTFYERGLTLDSIGLWDVRGVESMLSLAVGGDGTGTHFNAPIENWETDSLIFIRDAFENNTEFNRPIGSWNVSSVTDVSELFYNATAFNQDLSNWDLSSCNVLFRMFSGASSFNNGGATGIDDWEFGPGPNIDMRYMFQNAALFNQPVGNWDVSNVTLMTSMFQGADAFNNGGSTSIDSWDVSNVTTFRSMFQGADVFNQPIGSWDVSSSGDNFQMFFGAASFNQDIGSWDVSSFSNCVRFFSGASSFNNGGSTSINSWNTTNFIAGNCTEFMQNCSSFNQPIGNWDTSNATNTRNMFENCSSFNQDVGSWDVSSSANFGKMFSGASSFNNGGSTSISEWDVSSSSSFFAMFDSASAFNQPIGSWNVSSGTNFGSMFAYNTGFDQDIGGWTMSNATSMGSMFRSSHFTNGGSTSISEWDVSNVTNMGNMVQDSTCEANFDTSGWDTSSVTTVYRMARRNEVWEGIGMENWDFSSLTNGGGMFSEASSADVDLGNVPLNTASTPDFESMLNSSGFSVSNYSKTLVGWANFVFDNGGPYNVTFGASGLQYSNVLTSYPGYGSEEFTTAPAARAFLTGATAGWTITDSGQA